MISLCLRQRFDGLIHIGAHRNLCDINIAVGHCDFGKVFLSDRFTGRSKLRDLAKLACF